MKKIISLLVAVCAVFCLCVPNARTADEDKPNTDESVAKMETLDNLQKIQKGDQISYQVPEDWDPVTNIVVSDYGELRIPYYDGGALKVVGKTCREVAFEIKKLLEGSHYKRATVMMHIESISAKNTGSYTIGGCVRSPGLQSLLPGETITVSMAIVRAGGATDFANLRKVKLTRIEDGRSTTYELNMKNVLEKGDRTEDMDLQAGDLILVPQGFFR